MDWYIAVFMAAGVGLFCYERGVSAGMLKARKNLHRELGQIKWGFGADEGWELAIEAVRKSLEPK